MKSPIQKLLRLKQIEQTLRSTIHAPNYSETREALYKERDAILASVGAPPLELIGNGDAHEWTAAFVATFPGLDVTDVYAWFANAILAGYDAGMRDGTQAESDVQARRADDGAEAMASTLRMIRDGLARGIVRSQFLKLPDAEGACTLDQIITEALRKAGRE